MTNLNDRFAAVSKSAGIPCTPQGFLISRIVITVTTTAFFSTVIIGTVVRIAAGCTTQHYIWLGVVRVQVVVVSAMRSGHAGRPQILRCDWWPQSIITILQCWKLVSKLDYRWRYQLCSANSAIHLLWCDECPWIKCFRVNEPVRQLWGPCLH